MEYDPGGTKILHCLGGKPQFKKGGMSEIMVGPSYGPWILAGRALLGPLDVFYKRQKQRWGRPSKGSEETHLYLCRSEDYVSSSPSLHL